MKVYLMSEMYGGIIKAFEIERNANDIEHALKRNFETKTLLPSDTDIVTRKAIEVLAGKWGNGNDRKTALTRAGYDYNVIQNRVNQLIVNDTRFNIQDVIYNPPATIVKWQDGTKTVVKCSENDEYDWEKGLALCVMKKVYGNTGRYNDIFKKYAPETDDSDWMEALRNIQNVLNSILGPAETKEETEKEGQENGKN